MIVRCWRVSGAAREFGSGRWRVRVRVHDAWRVSQCERAPDVSLVLPRAGAGRYWSAVCRVMADSVRAGACCVASSRGG